MKNLQYYTVSKHDNLHVHGLNCVDTGSENLTRTLVFLLYVSCSCCRCSRCIRDDEEHRFTEENRSANNLSSCSEGLIKHNVTVNTRGLLCDEDRAGGALYVRSLLLFYYMTEKGAKN